MSSLMKIVENEQTSELYPTPEKLVEKMLNGIDWKYINTVLEPSAGKGDILRVLAKKEKSFKEIGFDVDCIEIDQNLRQILRYNFGAERKNLLKEEHRKIRGKYKYCEERYGKGWVYYNEETRQYEQLPKSELQKLSSIDSELDCFFKNGIHIIHDDFLTYQPFKKYDLIVMNPPFSNGDKHLLKALEIQKNGGNIVCILNAETILNPYTETRRELKRKLDEYGAQVQFIENAFTDAERRTGVEIALVKVCIEQVQEESEIYSRFQKSEQMDDFQPNLTELEVSDYIKAAVTRFNVEVKSGLELIRQYRAMLPYMSKSFGDDVYGQYPILRLTDSTDRGYDSVSVNDYLKAVRLKYWRALLSNPKFIGKLTSKLQEEYRKKVDSLSDYDFSEFNIRTLSIEMNAQIKSGVESEILAMFDRLTEEHSWYPETKNNRHYYDGWATNKAHKIEKKVIIPCYGIFSGWSGKPEVYDAMKCLEDIERILNYLDGGMTADVDMKKSLEEKFNDGITKNISLKYFTATFYKKGTVHLVFNCPELIERFNIYAAQNKNWLPPCYGKKKYSDMTGEEKAVVDSFQGEKAYNDILAKASYYLSPVTSQHQTLFIE